MAFEEELRSMHDQTLRPRLLHAVMANHLPDEKQVTRTPGQLSMAVESLRQHHLLWESSILACPELHYMQGAKVSDFNNGAVDAWIEKLLNLLSSTVVCTTALPFNLVFECLISLVIFRGRLMAMINLLYTCDYICE